MKILFVASEAVPFCKTGGLADVVGTLAQKLGAAGHDVCMFLPKYRAVRAPQLEEGQARPLRVTMAGGEYEIGLRFLHRRAVTTYFVDYPSFFDRDGLYGVSGRDHEDNDRRFALFCAAALEGAKAVGFKPDVIHAHDWQAGPVCTHLKRRYASDPHFAGARSVFTVHNMAYQGLFPRAALEPAGFLAEDWTTDGLEYYGQVSYLKAGLAYADKITTVSPTYAREIQGSEHGFGFEGLLTRRAKDLRGVLNGLDTEVWDPSRDSSLPRRYGAEDAASGKAACKEALQRECGLEVRADQALIGVVSRLDYQKGLDLAIPAVEARLDSAQFVVLGTGDPALTEQLAALERRHPGRVHFHRQFDESFAHRVYAASDIFLMPSRFEPCGLGQMIAMRYGSIPIAARTGGLSDTVFEEASPGRKANGYLCAANDGADLARALGRALDARRAGAWDARVRAAMAGDFSWDRSVSEYVAVYREAARR
ncbi:MAG: glycogen synthase GlgA [Elusimicrobia bacterium]|nr:glycogen synthase GlgA [Elusimicrobiota bacterium]